MRSIALSDHYSTSVVLLITLFVKNFRIKQSFKTNPPVIDSPDHRILNFSEILCKLL